MGWPKRVMMYVHGSKDAALAVAEKAGLKYETEAGRLASFALCELTCEIDLHKDGRAELVSVSDGVTTLRR